jgi:hypothetical protein
MFAVCLITTGIIGSREKMKGEVGAVKAVKRELDSHSTNFHSGIGMQHP